MILPSVIVNVGVPQPPQFGSISSANGTFQLTVTNPTNPPASIIIQASTNLAVQLGSRLTPTPLRRSYFTNSDSTNYPLRFYRALLGP